MKVSRLVIALIIAMAVVAEPSSAFAYLEPGSGSMILQALTGALVAGGLTFKIYWHKISAFFAKKPAEPTESEKSDAPPS